MDPLDKYVQAVKSWLPQEQRADILAEIAEDLRSEVEDQEAARGRGLDDAEIQDLLRRRGHPMWLAEAYLPRQYLIGPVLLPIYWRVVKVALGALAAVFVVLHVVFGVFAPEWPPLPVGGLAFWSWQLVIWAFAYLGLATMIFAVIERTQAAARAAGHWDPARPHDLPTLPRDEEARTRLAVRGSAATDFVTDLVTALWWGGLLSLPSLPVLAVSPLWRRLHGAVLAFLVASTVVALWVCWRGTWSRERAGARLLVDLGGLVLAGVLFFGGNAVVIALPGHAEPAKVAKAVSGVVNGVVRWGVLLPIAVCLAARIVQDARRVTGRRPIASKWLSALTGA